ncbi:PucR family transcriptional regulator [Pseudonocardia sp. CA-107938]|uniref:PucR family transcriptional regulator n=1 Tax=Pseudonocardia sp. CA-107938 TaxID=3240021 RepID=UPI003D911186
MTAKTAADGLDRPWARVPSWVAGALRPELDGASDEIIAAVRAEVPDFARPMTGRFGMRITEGVTVALNQFLDLLGRDVPLTDVRIYRSLGQLEHGEGRTLAALQATYQVSSRTLWRRLAASDTARTLPPEVIFRLAEALFTYIEAVSAASAEGWAAEETGRVGSVQARRRALVEVLARRPPAQASVAEIEAAAADAGWHVPAKIVALVVEDAVAVAGRLPGAVGADLGPSGIVVVAAPDEAGMDRITVGLRGRSAVLGPAVEPAEAHRSIARARAVWALHRADLVEPDALIVHAEEHLLALLVHGEPEIADDLRERALGKLRDLPAGGSARAEETLRAWLDAHGDVTATAGLLHVHPQTVRYRLAGLRDLLGEAMDDPVRRLELALALRFPGEQPPEQ